jgi:hypothetical protein
VASYRRALGAPTPEWATRVEAAARLSAMGSESDALEVLDRAGAEGDPAAVYLAAKLKFAWGAADKGANDLRRLGERSREDLAKRLRSDAAFWQEIRRQGAFPADLEDVAASPLGGEETPSQHGMGSKG